VFDQKAGGAPDIKEGFILLFLQSLVRKAYVREPQKHEVEKVFLIRKLILEILGSVSFPQISEYRLWILVDKTTPKAAHKARVIHMKMM